MSYMKKLKIIIVVLSLSLFLAGNTQAEGTKYSHWYSPNTINLSNQHLDPNEESYNGYFMEENDDEYTKLCVDIYIHGLIGMAYSASEASNHLIHKLYPKYTYSNIVDTIRTYYHNNPAKRHRTVIDVLLTGCK